jgi:two-component system, chemotaxis family, sensor kinase Cph1
MPHGERISASFIKLKKTFRYSGSLFQVRVSRLFQNLIGNAIKFRSQLPLKIHISAQRKEDEWLFSIKGTGIGIKPEQFKRIFVIFQRLHTRAEYSGTGIGLAICKKIVERHSWRNMGGVRAWKELDFFLYCP